MAEVELGKRRDLLEIVGARAHRKDLATFLDSAERRAGLSREERLRIVEQALLLMEMNYVHLPMKRAIHAIDPIQRLKLLRFRLAEEQASLEPTLHFHRRMLSIFGSTRDLHTLPTRRPRRRIERAPAGERAGSARASATRRLRRTRTIH